MEIENKIWREWAKIFAPNSSSFPTSSSPNSQFFQNEMPEAGDAKCFARSPADALPDSHGSPSTHSPADY